MTDYETPRLERVAQKPIVGIDGDGATHHFDAVRRTVYVVTADDIQRTEPLGARPLSAWVAYVAEQRGWRDCRYTEQNFADQLAAEVRGS